MAAGAAWAQDAETVTVTGTRIPRPELDLPNLSQSIHNFAADFVGDVQLHHAHVRRAEHGVLVGHSEEIVTIPPGRPRDSKGG